MLTIVSAAVTTKTVSRIEAGRGSATVLILKLDIRTVSSCRSDTTCRRRFPSLEYWKRQTTRSAPESGQLQRLLQFFQTVFMSGRSTRKRCSESELGVLLNQIDHVAFFAALRVDDVERAGPGAR